MSSRHYLGTLVLACAGFIGLAATFNFIIDPYNIFGSFVIEGVNTSKPATGNRTGLAKTYMVERATGVRTLVIGSSRVDIGIDPASESIPVSARPGFNLAVAGSTPYQQLRFLQHAEAFHDISTVLLGIEFETFLDDVGVDANRPAASDAFEQRLVVDVDGRPNTARWIQLAIDGYRSLVSLTAVKDSLHTIAAGDDRWLRKDGLSDGSLRFGREVRSKGHYSVFRDTLQGQLKWLSSKAYRENGPAVTAFEDMLAHASARGQRLRVIMLPAHVFQHELWDRQGLGADLARWKFDMAALVDDFYRKGADVELWDFATVNRYTTEAVPGPGIKQAMAYYWEPMHFKSALGERLLAQVFDAKDDVGVRLQGELCDHLDSTRQALQVWRSQQREQLNLLDSMLDDVRDARASARDDRYAGMPGTCEPAASD